MTATPDATDETSGIASSSSSCGTVDTFTAGEQTLDCTATDVAGNTTEVTVDYVGVSVTMLSTPTRAKFKAGSTIPAKFTLTGADGQPIAADLAAQLSSACGATVTLTGQATVCAVYDPVKRIFVAAVKSPEDPRPSAPPCRSPSPSPSVPPPSQPERPPSPSPNTRHPQPTVRGVGPQRVGMLVRCHRRPRSWRPHSTSTHVSQRSSAA